MDVLIFVICLSFLTLFSLVGVFTRKGVLVLISIFLSIFVILGLFYDGLTMTVGYSLGSAVSESFDIFPVVLIPFALLMLNVYNAMRG